MFVYCHHRNILLHLSLDSTQFSLRHGSNTKNNERTGQLKQLAPNKNTVSVIWTHLGFTENDIDTCSAITLLFMNGARLKKTDREVFSSKCLHKAGVNNKHLRMIDSMKRWKEITEGIFYYIRKDMAPIATVEHWPLTEDVLWHREKRCSPIWTPATTINSVLLTFFAHVDVSRFLLWAWYVVTLSSRDTKPDKTASNMHIIKSTVLKIPLTIQRK